LETYIFVGSHVKPGEIKIRCHGTWLGSGEQIVDREYLTPSGEDPVDQLRAEESGSAGHQNTFATVATAYHVKFS
jgi:hypothetical protein